MATTADLIAAWPSAVAGLTDAQLAVCLTVAEQVTPAVESAVRVEAVLAYAAHMAALQRQARGLVVGQTAPVVSASFANRSHTVAAPEVQYLSKEEQSIAQTGPGRWYLTLIKPIAPGAQTYYGISL